MADIRLLYLFERRGSRRQGHRNNQVYFYRIVQKKLIDKFKDTKQMVSFEWSHQADKVVAAL